MIRVVVDSTADIPAPLAAEAGITVVPILVQFGQQTLRDTEISHDQFYSRLVETAEIPRTAATPIGLFEEAFRELTANGDGVLSISVSSKLSSTFTAARQAAQLVENANIVCLECGTTIAPMADMAFAAAKAAREGATMDELVALVERMKQHALLIFGVDTLRYLEKGGRIGRVQALLGTMLSVKPIIEVRNGDVLPLEQVRTSKRVPARLVELAKDRGQYESFSVLYTTNPTAAESLADLCSTAMIMSRSRIRIVQVGPALGTHAGPNALGVAGILKG